MTDSQDKLLSLFQRIAPIEGVSHKERRIADEVTTILRNAGVTVIEDRAASLVKGDAGNLICLPPRFDKLSPAIMLTAHLDTVQPTSSLKLQLSKDRVTSDGRTILGADNRMGVAVLIDLLRDLAESGVAHKNFFVLLTVCEETGLFGAEAFDASQYFLTSAFVFDCSRRPGVYIRKAAGITSFRVDITGRAAHAGVAPEEGISAIAIAAKAVSRLQLGRIDDETTVNIGKIRGGEAVNIVPDNVVMEGEVRSCVAATMTKLLRELENTFITAASDGAKARFATITSCAPYMHAPDAPVVVELAKALVSAGLRPQPIVYMGGSDANVYNAKGIPAVNIGIGAQKPHSTEEFFLLEDLASASRIARELVRLT